MNRFVQFFGGVCLMCGIVVSAWAVDPPNADKPNPDKPNPDKAPPAAGAVADQGATMQNFGMMTPQENDRRIIRWLDVDNKSIIECSQSVAGRSTRDDLKEFARTIVNDHDTFRNKLNAWSSQSTAQPAPQNGQRDANNSGVFSATLIKDDGAARAGKMLFQPTDFVSVKEKVCDKLHNDAKKYFEKLSADEFDRAYVVHMTMAHEALIASIDAVSGSATPELQAHLKELKDAAQHHLDRLKELSSSLATAKTAAISNDADQK